jgi:chromosome partitioning protein
MPTLSAVSPKGGAGKTTTMANLAYALVKKGAQVALLDADPNAPLGRRLLNLKCPEGLTIIPNVTEDNIAQVIRDAAAKFQFVLVDLEGTAAKIVVNALQQTDFVIIPMRGSHLDADEASKAIKLVIDQELAVQRHVPHYKLPYAILLTETPSAYESRITKGLRHDLNELQVPMFEVELKSREAFKAIFKFNCPLEQLDPVEVSGIDTAIENAEALAAEVIIRLQDEAQKAQQRMNPQSVPTQEAVA